MTPLEREARAAYTARPLSWDPHTTPTDPRDLVREFGRRWVFAGIALGLGLFFVVLPLMLIAGGSK